MSFKVLGFIATTPTGGPVTGHYGQVLLFTRLDDAAAVGKPLPVIRGASGVGKRVVTRHCAHCGGPFTVDPADKRTDTREFCGDSCRQLAYRKRKEGVGP
jgi:hypothetical protein